MNRGGELDRDDSGRAFAFKLHQFIGQGRALFATLEPADHREFSLEGQIQASGRRLLAPIKFCRQCGQDYYCVFCNGAMHAQPEQATRDAATKRELLQRGYRVLVMRYGHDLREQIIKHPDVFGVARSLAEEQGENIGAPTLADAEAVCRGLPGGVM